MNSLWDKLPDDLKGNPFFHFSEETNFVPAWDKIRMQDAGPALNFVLDHAAARIAAIAENPARPTFKNTVQPLEEAFGQAGYFFRVLYALTPANPEEEEHRRKLERDLNKRWYKVFTDAFDNVPLFDRFTALCTPEQIARWSTEEQTVGGMYFNSFYENGIKLDPEKRKALRKMESRVFDLSNTIHQKMRDAGEKTAMTVTDAAQLDGIPQDMVDQAAAEAVKQGLNGAWSFLPNRVTYESLMRTAANGQFRKDMWTLYHKKRMTGKYATEGNILEYAKLTYDVAHLKSRKTPAAEILKYNMAKTPQAVSAFLRKLRDASMPVALRELDILREYAAKNLGIRKLEPWDLNYTEECIKKKVFGFTEEDLRPYFELDRTLEKLVFPHFKKQLGVVFTAAPHHAIYHPDVRAYEVNSRSGRRLGTLFLDLYDRPGKMAGIAWSMSVLPQGMFEGKVRRPVNQINMKLTLPASGNPTLMTPYDLSVLLHELGHSLHDIKSQCKYSSRSGTGVDTDFVEFPSQYQEFISFDPEFLRAARHHETGEFISESVLEKLSQSRKFMAGRETLNRAMLGWLDLQWHNRNPHAYTSVRAFEDDTLKSFRLPGIEYPHYSKAFSYTFGGGYDSSFYAYQWAQVRSDDLFEISKRKGLYDRSLTAKFARVLAKGGVVSDAQNYRELAGRDPSLKPMLRATGLIGKAFNYSAALQDIPEAANDAVIPHKQVGQPQPDVA